MARQAHFRALSKSKTGIYKNSNPNLVHHGTPFYHAVAFAFVATKYLLYYGAVVKGYALCAFLWGFFAFGCGGIGHEALHSGTFTTPRRNRLACFALLDVVGISSFMYQRVHSFGHHLHTNERGASPDLPPCTARPCVSARLLTPQTPSGRPARVCPHGCPLSTRRPLAVRPPSPSCAAFGRRRPRHRGAHAGLPPLAAPGAAAHALVAMLHLTLP